MVLLWKTVWDKIYFFYREKKFFNEKIVIKNQNNIDDELSLLFLT